MPLTRAVHAFDDDLNKAVSMEDAVLDTSFVVDAMVDGEPRHHDALRYLEILAAAGTTLYLSRLLEIELVEAAYKLSMREHFGSVQRAASMRHDGRALRRANRMVDEIEAAWLASRAKFTFEIVEPHDVVAVARPLLRRGLSSYDAIHAATAIWLGVPNIVTCDAGFGAVREQDLEILTHSSVVTRTRALRARYI